MAAIDADRWLDEADAQTIPSVLPPRSTASATAAMAVAEPAEPDTSDVQCNLETEACMLSLVSSKPVLIFSKTYCPFCEKAKAAIAAKRVLAYIIEIDLLDGAKMTKIQTLLAHLTGRRTG